MPNQDTAPKKRTLTVDTQPGHASEHPKKEVVSQNEVPHMSTDALLKKQIALMERIVEQNERLQRKQKWIAFFGLVRFLFIVIPILIGLWYLMPFVEQYTQLYGELLGQSGASQGSPIEYFLSQFQDEGIQAFLGQQQAQP